MFDKVLFRIYFFRKNNLLLNDLYYVDLIG